ncbi:hypothetical protein Phum_PHUM168080 [Pediculus humanus corporis]|uniref:Uncharacterized protein n=1 Tax=Pediculus humanus subsp. corporis TaxID=121224 RepID=E0VFV1_PEDHC|nr:uncharacterized protein Phum_PHUM168080 [Pediculus humanus corporis]EEB12257.1 hypothetical protein Phum_PHUM168080 [Pediculus humanus corporis]
MTVEKKCYVVINISQNIDFYSKECSANEMENEQEITGCNQRTKEDQIYSYH